VFRREAIYVWQAQWAERLQFNMLHILRLQAVDDLQILLKRMAIAFRRGGETFSLPVVSVAGISRPENWT